MRYRKGAEGAREAIGSSGSWLGDKEGKKGGRGDAGSLYSPFSGLMDHRCLFPCSATDVY